jgi:hypothetical protein
MSPKCQDQQNNLMFEATMSLARHASHRSVSMGSARSCQATDQDGTTCDISAVGGDVRDKARETLGKYRAQNPFLEFSSSTCSASPATPVATESPNASE